MSAKKSKNAEKKSTEKKAKKLSKKQLKKQIKKQGKAAHKIAKKQEKAIRKAAKKLEKNLSRVGGTKEAKKTKGLSSGKAAVAKTPKAAKAGVPKNARKGAGVPSFELNLGTCPCCSKRCPLTKPKCGKGRAVARKKRERLMGEAAA
ncbi:MAG: hypothetical protein Q4B69_00740 [Slackia sp.]|nr:hypothetical protein [Slackia sp.]